MRKTRSKDYWTVKAHERHVNNKPVKVKGFKRSASTSTPKKKLPTKKKLFGIF